MIVIVILLLLLVCIVKSDSTTTTYVRIQQTTEDNINLVEVALYYNNMQVPISGLYYHYFNCNSYHFNYYNKH
jgi:hypothetical protein